MGEDEDVAVLVGVRLESLHGGRPLADGLGKWAELDALVVVGWVRYRPVLPV